MNGRTSEAAVSFLERVAFTNLKVKAGTLGHSIGEMSPSVLHRVARSHGVLVDDAGKLRCPDGEFTNVFGSNCVIPDGPDFKRAAQQALDFFESNPLTYRPGFDRNDGNFPSREYLDDRIREHRGIIQGSIDEALQNPEHQLVGNAALPSVDDVVGDIEWSARGKIDAIAIAVEPEILERVLRDGRFKNQLESGDSRGSYDPPQRRFFEAFLGVPEEAPDHQRPIYGFGYAPGDYPDGLDGAGVGSYGSTRVTLKPSVDSRSTVTFGDSLDDSLFGINLQDLRDGKVTEDDLILASGEAFLRSLTDGRIEDTFEGWNDDKFPFERRSYIEAQIHGGVTVADIESVEFSPWFLVSPDSADRRERLRKALDSLEIQHNIPEPANLDPKFNIFDRDDDSPIAPARFVEGLIDQVDDEKLRDFFVDLLGGQIQEKLRENYESHHELEWDLLDRLKDFDALDSESRRKYIKQTLRNVLGAMALKESEYDALVDRFDADLNRRAPDPPAGIPSFTRRLADGLSFDDDAAKAHPHLASVVELIDSLHALPDDHHLIDRTSIEIVEDAQQAGVNRGGSFNPYDLDHLERRYGPDKRQWARRFAQDLDDEKEQWTPRIELVRDPTFMKEMLKTQALVDALEVGPGNPIFDEFEAFKAQFHGMEAANLAHEIGHLVDFNDGGRFHVGDQSSPAVINFLSLWFRSQTRVRLAQHPNPRYVAYASDPIEIWARAYAQWVVHKMPDGPIKDGAMEYMKSRVPSGSQWADGEEFEDVMDAVEAILRERGILV